jgi:DNA-directed RNA polymerase specialized sigma24 family protein
VPWGDGLSAAQNDFVNLNEVSRMLDLIQQSEPSAAERLLPLVYDELRRLAAAQLACEKPGQTLDATALVHEAYMRLAGDRAFADRHHFFRVAAEAMRRIRIRFAGCS